MQQRVRWPHRGKDPSSTGQLPVPAALNARSPTLFTAYYTRYVKKSKYLLAKNGKSFSIQPERDLDKKVLKFPFRSAIIGKRYAGFVYR